MLAALHKITALLLVMMLSAAGLASATDRCASDCPHHSSVQVKPACCAHGMSAEEGMNHHKPVSAPCSGGSLCGHNKTSHESLLQSSVSTDQFLALPVDAPVITYKPIFQRLTEVYPPEPDTSPPIYKLHCSYLH